MSTCVLIAHPDSSEIRSRSCCARSVCVPTHVVPREAWEVLDHHRRPFARVWCRSEVFLLLRFSCSSFFGGVLGLIMRPLGWLPVCLLASWLAGQGTMLDCSSLCTSRNRGELVMNSGSVYYSWSASDDGGDAAATSEYLM